MHASIADVIADTAQNSIEAGASRIEVSVVEDGRRISVTIRDNGKGMDEAVAARAFDPFFTEPGKHDKRKVGLGLPILKQICDAVGGSVSLDTAPGKGTTLSYSFDAAHIDLPPRGDFPSAIAMLFNYPGSFELVFSHRGRRGEYEISRSDLADAVGGFEDPAGYSLAVEFLASQEAEL